jgi:hypothetical protein
VSFVTLWWILVGITAVCVLIFTPIAIITLWQDRGRPKEMTVRRRRRPFDIS